MTPDVLWILTAGVFVVATLYSSVGHAGASGYIAVMSLLSVAPQEIRPIALTLNILVASIGTWQFWRAGHFSWSLFWPFALLSVPAAFAGGYLNLPTQVFKVLVGSVLLFSAAQFLLRPPSESDPRHPPTPVAVGLGGGLGLLSGLTGTGGGIFLTPLLILTGWARTKSAAAVSAPFILLNSASGLLGNLSATKTFPAFGIALLVAAVVGGSIGSYFGSHRLPHTAIKRLLAVVLCIAGFKLILT
ncbi:MAG: sulfite exporter TauE/SafE family protein [Gammaproteobacteria bacterium]|nr:sulfite exporter TauE/SafE family protein [Gammaproteobacteria bacterium]